MTPEQQAQFMRELAAAIFTIVVVVVVFVVT